MLHLFVFLFKIFAQKMGFFDKLKSELKFKKLGKGKSLKSEPPTQSQPSQSQFQSSSSKSPRKPSNSEAQNAAREAALARLAGKKPSSSNKSNNNILRRAKEELLEEKRRQLEAERQQQIDEAVNNSNQSKEKHVPKVCQTNGVYFKCPLTDTKLQRHEIDDHLLELLAQFIEQHKNSMANCYNAPEPEDFKILLNIVYTINDCTDEKYKTCMATLTTYLNNIISNPDQEKFRKIRKSNKAFQNRIANFNCGSNLLEIIGFGITMLPNNEGVNEEYYVFDIEKYNSNSTPNFVEILAQWVYNFSQDPQRVVFELDNNAQLFYKSPGSSAKLQTDLPADFYNISKAELKNLYSNQEKTREFNSVLMSNETRQKMLAMKSKKYKYCMVRIKFPDELILQGTFRATDSAQKVYNFVRKNIIFEEVIGSMFKLSCGNEVLRDCSEDNLEKYSPSCMFTFRLASDMVNDIREQSGSLHLVKKDLLCNIQQL